MSSSPSTVEVLVPVALDRPFTYGVPEGVALQPGDIVKVPLGSREVTGVVWDGAAPKKPKRLKDVLARLERPPLPEELRKLIAWVARYTLSPMGLVLRMALSGSKDIGPERGQVVYRATGAVPASLTAARERVLAVLADEHARGKTELAREAGVSPSVIEGLVKEGALRALERHEPPPGFGLVAEHLLPHLTADQSVAVEALTKRVRDEAFSVVLLEGVTGAGKTEVYLEAVAEVLRKAKQALILLPEIALTQAVIARVADRFGAMPAEWHSSLTPRQRARTYEAVASGAAGVVVGARSALFLPFQNLGLIVVDEEHDASFKQEEGVIYHGRDMAVVRAQMAGVPAVLVSATPALETQVNAARGRYQHLVLPERFGGRALPDVKLVDLIKTPPERGRFIAPPLEEAVRETLGRGEQVLLFLNRRGYAPLTLCRACGYRFVCKSCSAWLVEHRTRARLMCHHCGYEEPTPHSCPSCHTEGKLAPCGPGVERLREEAGALFPEARLSVLSSDVLDNPEMLRAELEAVAAGEVDLVIGTQLVAKGHNFPHLTLVGVVDADVGLGTADPRAAERTFQLLDQVTGRAGRGARAGRALIQTFDAAHPVMRALARGDRVDFYAAERTMRERAELPPFGRLASVIVSAASKAEAEGYARALARAFPDQAGVRLLGPAEAALALVRGRHRQRLLVKAARGCDLPGLMRGWLERAPRARGSVSVDVDIDPVSFM